MFWELHHYRLLWETSLTPSLTICLLVQTLTTAGCMHDCSSSFHCPAPALSYNCSHLDFHSLFTEFSTDIPCPTSSFCTCCSRELHKWQLHYVPSLHKTNGFPLLPVVDKAWHNLILRKSLATSWKSLKVLKTALLLILLENHEKEGEFSLLLRCNFYPLFTHLLANFLAFVRFLKCIMLPVTSGLLHLQFLLFGMLSCPPFSSAMSLMLILQIQGKWEKRSLSNHPPNIKSVHYFLSLNVFEKVCVNIYLSF